MGWALILTMIGAIGLLCSIMGGQVKMWAESPGQSGGRIVFDLGMTMALFVSAITLGILISYHTHKIEQKAVASMGRYLSVVYEGKTVIVAEDDIALLNYYKEIGAKISEYRLP